MEQGAELCRGPITTVYVGDQVEIDLAAGWSSRHCRDYSAPGARSSSGMATGQSPPNQSRPCWQPYCKVAQACWGARGSR